jgi:hypothetical protein
MTISADSPPKGKGRLDIAWLFRIRDWPSLYQAALVVGMLVGAFWSIVRFANGVYQQSEAATMEARKPFSLKQLDTYEKVVTLAAEVAEVNLPDNVRNQKQQELDMLVNGPLALVADGAVLREVRKFYDCLADETCKHTADRAGHLARHIGYACRDSLGTSWHVQLTDLFEPGHLR